MAFHMNGYSNFHELNIDWFLKKFAEFYSEYAQFKIDWANLENDWEAQQQAFQALQQFVTEYFDNLDVQQEINNKLDEMAEDGTLWEIMKDYIEIYVTPEMFGAAGDGITDDTEAVQSAINSGKTVFMTGTYKINSGIQLRSNLNIFGFGKGTITKEVDPETHYASFYYYGDNIENVMIDGLNMTGLQHWTGQTLSGYANDYGIRLINCKNVTVKNCDLSEFGGCALSLYGSECRVVNNVIIYTGSFTGAQPNYNFGIEYDGSDMFISNNLIKGVIQGILSGLINTNVIISNNNITTNGQHGLYMESGINVLVSNNVIHDCTIVGVKFQRGVNENEFKDITITGNNIERCGLQGVLFADLSTNLVGFDNVLISENNIYECVRGIQAINVNNLKIADNVLTGTNETKYGILTDNCRNINISDNYIDTTDNIYGSGAVVVNAMDNDTSVKNVVIKNNTMRNTSGFKFQQDHTIENLLIDGNNFNESPGTFDITFDYQKAAADAVVCNNVCPKGMRFLNDTTKIKRCFNNIGITYKDSLTFDITNASRASINSQDSYLKGDINFINIDFTILQVGTASKTFSAPITGLSFSGDYTYELNSYTDPSASTVSFRILYLNDELQVYITGGKVNEKYAARLII